MNKLILAALIVSTTASAQHQIYKPYWTPPSPIGGVGTPEWEYHAHSSVCGAVLQQEKLLENPTLALNTRYYQWETLKSGGAKSTETGQAASFEEAKKIVENQCK